MKKMFSVLLLAATLAVLIWAQTGAAQDDPFGGDPIPPTGSYNFTPRQAWLPCETRTYPDGSSWTIYHYATYCSVDGNQSCEPTCD